MRFRNLDANDDWCFGNGRNSYASGQRAIDLNIKTSLYTFLGEIFWDLTRGVDWWNLCGARGAQAEANIILQTRKAIAECEGVISISSVSSRLTASTRRLSLSYTINSIYTRNLRNTVTIP